MSLRLHSYMLHNAAAIEQASHRWRGGRRDDSARTHRKILISTQVLDAALVDAIRAALAQQPSKPSTLTKIRAHLKAARRLPRSVKTVPLRALLDAYAEYFYVDGVHVHARPSW